MTITGMVRREDHSTSVEGALAVVGRAESQRTALYAAYRAAGDTGLTDYEAAIATGLAHTDAIYWKRCSELRQDGYIRKSDMVRPGPTGINRMVCVYVDKE